MTDNELYTVLEITEAYWCLPPPSGTQLGKVVAKAWRDSGQGEPATRNQLINGNSIKVKVYPMDNPIVVATIKAYYDDLAARTLEQMKQDRIKNPF